MANLDQPVTPKRGKLLIIYFWLKLLYREIHKTLTDPTTWVTFFATFFLVSFFTCLGAVLTTLVLALTMTVFFNHY